MPGRQREPDERQITERIVEKSLIIYVSERQAWEYSNESDSSQQEIAWIMA